MDLGLYFYRLSSGDFVVARQNPSGDLSNPMFVVIDYFEAEVKDDKGEVILKEDGLPQKEVRRRVLLKPMIEILEGITAEDDNYFFVIKQSDVTLKTYPSKAMIEMYDRIARSMITTEVKKEEAPKVEEEKKEDNVVNFPNGDK